MATIAENLQTIKDSTDAIKQAIIDKGGTIEGNITTFADAISRLSGGGGSTGGPGSVFKITNKLNGQLFGSPTYTTSGIEEFHTYSFEGGTLKSISLFLIYEDDLVPEHLMTGVGYYTIASAKSENYGYYHVYFPSKSGILKWKVAADGYTPSDGKSLTWGVFATDTNGNYDIDFFKLSSCAACFLKNTSVTLSDNTTKLIQDITYNDELLVWNFDEGRYDKAKPLWIKKSQTSAYYYKITLENGSILKLVGSDGKCHRLFSMEDGEFVSGTDMVNKTVFTQDGNYKVISCELIEETVEFYNIITNYHINLFANGVLTSCRYNNLYPIQDMKFVKTNDKVLHDSKNIDEHPILSKYSEGLRLDEQCEFSIEEMIDYCTRLENLKL